MSDTLDQTVGTDVIARKKAAKGDWLRALQASARISADPMLILPRAFDAVVCEHGDKIALIGDTETFTFAELADRSNRYARWALANGIAAGDVVGLMLENRPEYVAIWLGLTRVGVIVALYNTNVVGPVLAHCVAISGANTIIAGSAYVETCIAATGNMAKRPVVLAIDRANGQTHLDLAIASISGAVLPEIERPDISQRHHALYIFTSGTTGAPKAAIVSHQRIMHWAGWFNALIGADPSDRMYHCLPMYHSLGAVVAVWATLLSGGSAAVRPRFSAASFWSDVARLDCTLFQYIGEMCRYLVTAPDDPAARSHRLRLVVGNGLRADIWPRFVKRFAIRRVIEFYAATESNFSLYNLEGEPGSIGRIPPFVGANRDIALVKFDYATDCPQRFDDGLCRLTAVNEPGEAIARIDARPDGGNTGFLGYLDRMATDKKILRDVFALGDAWMRSGDLMRRDERGFFYFVDRIGDTFRWKGENVATSEVAEMIFAFSGIVDANVLGVSIPGNDGRAGLAELVIDDDFNLTAFKRHLDMTLPSYARPVFIQVLRGLKVTETQKHSRLKPDLAQIDPNSPDFMLYAINPSRTEYVRVDSEMHRAFLCGGIRF